MKTYICGLLMGLAVFISSCNEKNNDCNKDALADVIIGKWEVLNSDFSFGFIEFLEDGTLIDTSEVLYGTIMPHTWIKRFDIPDNSTIHIFLKDTSANLDIATTYNVTGYDCNKVFVEEAFSPKIFVRR